MENIRLGIIGTGRIANRFIPELGFVDGIYAAGVYNPKINCAQSFARKHNVTFYTDKINELFNGVDAVYVASPHKTHYQYIKFALQNKKHVISEKPMCLKKEEIIELFKLAETSKCILMEGIKTAYCPGFKKLCEVLETGVIGKVRDVEACFTKLTDINSRELTDVETGGSLTELGSYTLFGIFKILGVKYDEIRVEKICNSDGLDLYTKLFIKYNDSFATSKTGLGIKSEGQMIISGTLGYIKVMAPWWKTTTFEICFEDTKQNQIINNEFLGDGLRYVISSFVNLIKGVKIDVNSEISIEIANVMQCFKRS